MIRRYTKQGNASVVLALALMWGTLCLSCKTTRSGRIGGTTGHTPTQVADIMKKVADWQIDSINNKGWRHPERDWTNGALFSGMLAYARLANDSRYYDFMKSVGEKYNWTLLQNYGRYFADNHCVGQLYCRMYQIYHQPEMIADLKRLADSLIARPHTASLEWKNNIHVREWAWCDALFMAPPSLAMLASVTGEKKYMDLMDSLWWKTTDYLYDPEEHLYYRDSRYFGQKEKNGKKVFWSRGNGWVMAGLVKVLEYMPDDYPDRQKWITLYRDMAAKIASLQQPDGTWHASLLDPAGYPVKETSGTGFYCYALAWGLTHNLLDGKTYAPVVWKAWDALVGCVHPNGMLGYVQPIGADPQKVNYDDTEVYAVGAFLLSGSELLDLLMKEKKYHPDATVYNASPEATPLRSLLSKTNAGAGNTANATYKNILTNGAMQEDAEVQPATGLFLQKIK